MGYMVYMYDLRTLRDLSGLYKSDNTVLVILFYVKFLIMK